MLEMTTHPASYPARTGDTPATAPPGTRYVPRTADAQGEGSAPDSPVAKVSLVLSVFDDNRPPLRMSDIVRRTGLSPTSTSRIVRELVSHGLLERRGHDLWPGMKLFEIGSRSRRPVSLRQAALPTLMELRHRTGHTTQLAVLEDRDVVYLEVLPGRERTGGLCAVGSRWPAHASAVGKALLAYFPPEWQEHYLSTVLDQAGPHTIPSPTALRDELARIHRHGTAYDQGTAVHGMKCIASPVLRGNGTPLAAISVARPLGRVQTKQVVRTVQEAAAVLTRHIQMDPYLAHM